MNFDFSRRTFIKGVASAASVTACTGFFFGPSKVKLAVCGVMGKGYSDWVPMYKSGKVEIVALCDCDASVRARAQERLAKDGVQLNLWKIPFYSDYRRLLDDCDSLRVDAMTISTPNHTHAAIAIPAMKKGIHCYVQIPLVRTLWELDYFQRTAQDAGVVTQLGNQGSSLDTFRRNVEILQSGILGDVREVHLWTNRPVWPQGKPCEEVVRGTADPITNGLNWDAWLGPARMRPFKGRYPDGWNGYNPWKLCQNVYHSFSWRGFRDFGCGGLEMACHMMNLPFMGLELGRVEDVGCTFAEELNEVAFPTKSSLQWTFAARESRIRPGVLLPQLRMYWYDGGQMPNTELAPEVFSRFHAIPKTGCLMVGSKGMVLMVDDYGAKCKIAMDGERESQELFSHPVAKAVPRRIPFQNNVATVGFAGGHYLEFLNAIMGEGSYYEDVKSRCFSDLNFSVPFIEALLTGVVAVQVPGESLAWDGAGRKFNSNAANALLRPYIREGFAF